MRLAELEGLEGIAELWSGSPWDSLAGCLWRLYLLRAWVYADPAGAAREFDAGRHHTPVHEVVAGVTDPPGPDDVRALVDTVLRGVRVGDFADTLFRAAAFARVAAAGRAHLDEPTATAVDVQLRRVGRPADDDGRPSSSRPPGWSSTADWAERRSADASPPAPPVPYTRDRVGPRQPRVPQLAATSGHAP